MSEIWIGNEGMNGSLYIRIVGYHFTQQARSPVNVIRCIMRRSSHDGGDIVLLRSRCHANGNYHLVSLSHATFDDLPTGMDSRLERLSIPFIIHSAGELVGSPWRDPPLPGCSLSIMSDENCGWQAIVLSYGDSVCEFGMWIVKVRP